MDRLIKAIADHTGARPEKHFKTTLFQSSALLLGVNCLEPGQSQTPHQHEDQDKFYYVVSGTGRFLLDEEQRMAGEGEVVWAPAGIMHGVTNPGDERLTMLVGIAPSP